MRKIFILIVASMLTACHHHDDPSPVDTVAERTVLVYMAAENNLSSFANDDLEEMLEGSKSLNGRQQLVVYVDRATSAPPFMAHVKDGLLTDSLIMEESLTADPAVLEKVLRQMKTDYPAESYGLVLWGHASGWIVSSDTVAYARRRAYGIDNGQNTQSTSGYWMNIPSMARAITNAMQGSKLSFVFSDCCNMGCVEVAYELRNVADYVIGSPVEIPDAGAPYHLIVPDLFDKANTFGQKVINDYSQYYLDTYRTKSNYYYNLTTGDLAGYSVPLSVVKTSEMESLAQATAALLATITEKVGVDGELDLDGVTYGGIYGSYRYAYDMYAVLKRNAPEDRFAIWAEAFKKAVPYSVYSAQWLSFFSRLKTDMQSFTTSEADCGMLSMFFPMTAYRNTSPVWNTTICQYQWNNVIRWEQFGW